MGLLRERSRVLRFAAGTQTRKYNGNVVNSFYDASKEYCMDHTGKGDCDPFTVTSTDIEGGRLSGDFGTHASGYIFDDFPVSGVYNNVWPRSHLITGSLTDGEYAALVKARTNPSRPSVESVVSTVELKDIPLMLKQIGSLRWSALRAATKMGRVKAVAGANLLGNFGIAPLISDAQALMDFTSAVDQRHTELNRLYTRGLRRTIELGNYSNTQEHTYSVHSTGVSLSQKWHKVTTEHVRGHARWYPNGAFPKDQQEVRDRAKAAILGLTVDFGTFWELLPWSWLVDYFANVGTVYDGMQNTVPATCKKILIMRTIETFSKGLHGFNMASGRVYTIPQVKSVSMKRISATPTVYARMPYLDGRQMSIIGSLSILGHFRRKL